MTDADLKAALVAAWERLGRPWLPDLKGSEIGNLPAWLDEHPRHEWGGVEWAIDIWRKQAAKGRPTERYWARSTALIEDADEVTDAGN